MTIHAFKSFFTTTLTPLFPVTEIDTFFFLLMEALLDMQRIDTVLKAQEEIPASKFSELKKALHRLEKEEPIQYILGTTEFYGLPFTVTPDTLIPRPETEELVAWVLESLSPTKNTTILDIGTGSGCIPIALKKSCKNTLVSAIDISNEALSIAKKNAIKNETDIQFHQADILTTSSLSFTNTEEFDLIISNPPYVRELEKAEISNNVLQNEPHLALFVSNENPLLFYSKIAELATKHLTESGLLFFEINQYLGKETVAMLRKKGFSNIELRKDIFKNDRMLKATWKKD